MSLICKRLLAMVLSGVYLAMHTTASFAQSKDELLGIKLSPEIQTITREIETKTGQKIHAEFIQQTGFLLASSFISDEGEAVIMVDYNIAKDAKKLESVIAHELLHLRLRVNNYPTFIFSPSVRTARGRAIDVEQDNINDLKDLIEHRIFMTEMVKFGLYKLIDIAGDTAKGAKSRKGEQDGRPDAINYARAILEYQNPRDIASVKQIYEANGWTRSLQTGREIADIISQTSVISPKDDEAVFLRCLSKLYSSAKSTALFRLSPDPSNKFFLRLVINTAQAGKMGH